MHTASPRQGENFCLCLLLLTVKEPTFYDDLKIFERHIYPTFIEACLARGLLEDNSSQRQSLHEAVVSHVLCLQKMRNLFAVLLTDTKYAFDLLALWLEFKQKLAEDYIHQHQNLTTEEAANTALVYIENLKMLSRPYSYLISDCHKHPAKQLKAQLMFVAKKLPMMWKVKMPK
ncbi:LOW QUALITY PROTEIN: ATP-dependent DNA helicase PIF1 [Elysia marginata]|uniref:ATP-dependent DNA helicase PIF1 n=1 Tax=Elysia marginata TaxID=1093978 RepID=A0AAV4EIU3_9GAST|nr:LOW QUALITY PROTEIN: ATP-dependent DNA helicase PIF1 [Elysia marginata]